MNKITITNAAKNDVPIILGLLYDLGRPKPEIDSDVEVFRKLVMTYLKDSDKTILVAKYNDIEIVGLVSVMFLQRLNQTTRELYIPELIVLEKFQRKGVGKMLINSCIGLGKKTNCHRIRLESGNKRIDSHKFYKNIGFEQHGLSFSMNL